MSMLTVRERVQLKWSTLTTLRKREMWLENTITGGNGDEGKMTSDSRKVKGRDVDVNVS